MKLQTKITIFFLIATAGLGGFVYGSSVQVCRSVVISDIKQNQAFDASLAKLVSPDFLTAMGK